MDATNAGRSATSHQDVPCLDPRKRARRVRDPPDLRRRQRREPIRPGLEILGADPSYLCTEWIPGEGLEAWGLSQFTHLPHAQAARSVLGMYAAVGELLARYHEAQRDARTSRIVRKPTPRRPSIAAIVRRVLAGNNLLGQARRVRSIDDPGSHNVVVDCDGTPWLIDLPADYVEVIIEQDVARLTRRLAGAYRRALGERGGPRRRHYKPVMAAVVAGYESRSDGAALKNRTVLYACLASDTTVNTLRSFHAARRGLQASGALARGDLRHGFRRVGAGVSCTVLGGEQGRRRWSMKVSRREPAPSRRSGGAELGSSPPTRPVQEQIEEGVRGRLGERSVTSSRPVR